MKLKMKQTSQSFDFNCIECINIQIYSQISENVICQLYAIVVMKNVSNRNAPVQEVFSHFFNSVADNAYFLAETACLSSFNSRSYFAEIPSSLVEA